ncbi:MAG: hypothetical protein HUK12_01335 [Muribaculaceae bacterium]|nr:hypothetical protein [Muribaculaceae bacterium]
MQNYNEFFAPQNLFANTFHYPPLDGFFIKEPSVSELGLSQFKEKKELKEKISSFSFIS